MPPEPLRENAILVNLTDHTITLYTGHTAVHYLPALHRPPVVHMTRRTERALDGPWGTIPLVYTQFERVEFMPDPAPNTYYIVATIVANALPDRQDLVVPDFLVRKDGRVVGCRVLLKANYVLRGE